MLRSNDTKKKKKKKERKETAVQSRSPKDTASLNSMEGDVCKARSKSCVVHVKKEIQPIITVFRHS